MPFHLKHLTLRLCFSLAILTAGLCLFSSTPIWAADELAETITEAAPTDTARRHLILTARNILVLKQEIDVLLATAPTRETTAKIERLQAQMDQLHRKFDALATQVPQESPDAGGKKPSDLLAQLEELTQPLLQALRDLTKKPRHIDHLKKQIAQLEEQLAVYQRASENIQRFLKDAGLPQPGPETQAYQQRIRLLQDKYDPELVKLNLEKARRNLEIETSDDESVLEAASKSFETFIKTRGRNLLVTLGTFLGLLWVLTRLRKWLVTRSIFMRMSPVFGKLFTAAYNIIVLTICMLTALACLFFFNDWLLISLVAVILLLVVWTSRQWIPKFLKEIKLILNLGTVREDERMIWQGVPWRVREIGLQAILENERLEGGEIRLPVHELIGKHSRQVVEHEPWFPTQQGDWVFLADGSYGQIECQTMEQVVLKLKGGAVKHFPTADFLASTPVNLSQGFRYLIHFGLDYAEQNRIANELPRLFEDGLEKILRPRFEGDPPDFNFLEVRFDAAQSSSLNLAIIVHAEGHAAPYYEEYQREIQTALVTLCNENQLTIPFNQLTVTLAGDTPPR